MRRTSTRGADLLRRGENRSRDLSAPSGGIAGAVYRVRQLCGNVPTGASPWQVEDDLRNTAGRSFARRPGEPPVYLLAHDQLQVLAVEMLGPRLCSYHERLDGWAITYRERGWPSDTPRYLLQGHAALLAAIGDRQRLLNHVTDVRRHEVAYTVFGHHHASLREIETAQAVLLGDDEPDLTALARLAVHRISLQESGSRIPASLPQLWARSGRVGHAQVLITLISDPVVRTRALMNTAEELHRTGHPERAARMLDTAEAMTSAFNQTFGDWLHRELADAATRIGDYDRVRRVVDDLRSAVSKAHVSASAALTALSAANREHAEQWYHDAEEAVTSKPAPEELFDKAVTQVDAIAVAAMATTAAELGHQQRAAKLAATAVDPESTYELRSQGDVAEVVTMLIRGGFLDAALSVAKTRPSDEDREDALLCIVQAMASNGDLDEAEALARTAEEARHRCARLAAVAVSAAWRAEPARADRLRAEVETTLDDLPVDSFRRSAVLDKSTPSTLPLAKWIPADDGSSCVASAHTTLGASARISLA